MPLLEVNDVHAYYGNIHALKGVSLTVEEGEIGKSWRCMQGRQEKQFSNSLAHKHETKEWAATWPNGSTRVIPGLVGKAAITVRKVKRARAPGSSSGKEAAAVQPPQPAAAAASADSTVASAKSDAKTVSKGVGHAVVNILTTLVTQAGRHNIVTEHFMGPLGEEKIFNIGARALGSDEKATAVGKQVAADIASGKICGRTLEQPISQEKCQQIKNR